MYFKNPWRFLNVSRKGSIGLWNKKLEFIKSYQINEQTSSLHNTNFNSTNNENKNHEHKKRSVWLNDACLLVEKNTICFATSKRYLRFYTISTEYFKEEFCIYGFKNVPNCMDYSFIVIDCSFFFNYFIIFCEFSNHLVPNYFLYSRKN